MPTPTPQQMYIDGEWVDAIGGATFERTSPFDGSLLSVHQEGDVADADRALAAARRSFDEGPWRHTPASERRALLRRVAARLRADDAAISRRLAAEVGQPNRFEVRIAAEWIDYYANLAYDHRDDAITEQDPHAVGLVTREPVGVAAVITAWNGPLAQLAWKAAPALAVGCSVVAKPSHLTSTPAIDLARLFHLEGLPPGAFNVVTSSLDGGARVGGRLTGSDAVDVISFTGSTATGRRIAEAAAANLTRVALELGGKSPHVIFGDVRSLDEAARAAYDGITTLGGQACQSGSRLIVHESVVDDIVERVVAHMDAAVLGDPLADDTTIGPMVHAAHQERVLGYIASGRDVATLVRGGAAPAGGATASGHFVEPTLFTGVPNDSRIAREEIFGPVLSVMTFREPHEALALANDTAYGLASGVWTQDIDLALRFAKGLRAGTVWVNTYRSSGLGTMPLGGYKASGLGRELGREGLEEYLETKGVHIRLDPSGPLAPPAAG